MDAPAGRGLGAANDGLDLIGVDEAGQVGVGHHAAGQLEALLHLGGGGGGAEDLRGEKSGSINNMMSNKKRNVAVLQARIGTWQCCRQDDHGFTSVTAFTQTPTRQSS